MNIFLIFLCLCCGDTNLSATYMFSYYNVPDRNGIKFKAYCNIYIK